MPAVAAQGTLSWQKRSCAAASAAVRGPDRLRSGPVLPAPAPAPPPAAERARLVGSRGPPGQAVRSPSLQPAGRPRGRPEPLLADQDRVAEAGDTATRLGGRDSGFWAGAGWTTLRHFCCPPCGTGGSSLRRRTAHTQQGEGSRAGGAFRRRGRGVSPMGDAGLSHCQRGRTGLSHVLISLAAAAKEGECAVPVVASRLRPRRPETAGASRRRRKESENAGS